MALWARLVGMDGERLWGGEGRWELGRGMEPDDLLCSRNARSRTPLVGRPQWKINQAPSPKRDERAWKGQYYNARSMRAVKGSLGHSPCD